MRDRARWAALTAAVTTVAACTAILGDDFEIAPSAGAPTGGGTGGVGGQTTGGGGTASTPCEPGSDTPCYSGDPATEGVGPCQAGVATCNDQGTGYGDCVGEVVPAPEDCTTTDDEDCSGGDCSGNGVFAEVYGEGVGFRLAVDSQDNVLLTGQVSGTVNFGGDNIISGPLPGDGYVVKLDADFGHVWDWHLSGTSLQEPRTIAVDGDGNVAIAGRFLTELILDDTTYPGFGEEDMFVAKFSSSGDVMWVRTYGDNLDQQARAVTMDSAGAVIVTGFMEGTVDFGGGYQHTSAGGLDLFVLKLDPDGNTMWAYGYGDSSTDQGQGIEVDTDDNIFVVGGYSGSINFGSLTYMSNVDGAGFITKLDADGDEQWTDAFGGAGETTLGLYVAVDSMGRPVFTGAFAGTAPFTPPLTSNGDLDAFVAQYTATGTPMWSRSFGAATLDEPCFVTVDPAGGVVITGRSTNDLDFGGGTDLVNQGSQDLYVAKYDHLGNHLWSHMYGDAEYQAGFSVKTDSLGWPIVTGQISGTVDFGNGPVTTSILNAFLAKLEP